MGTKGGEKMIKIDAYKCEWCGKIFQNEYGHISECKYDPKARTCITCGFGNQLIRDYNKKVDGVYCPRLNKVFEYPHDQYCPEYVRAAHYEPCTK